MVPVSEGAGKAFKGFQTPSCPFNFLGYVMNEYEQIKNRHSKEINTLPIFWAFSMKQFNEGMEKFGLEPTDTGKIYKLQGGGYYRRTDAKILRDMFARHEKEMSEAIGRDKTGEGFIFNMFDDELSSHEYIYTHSTEDTLEVLGLSIEDIEKNPALISGLKRAIKSQYQNQEA